MLVVVKVGCGCDFGFGSPLRFLFFQKMLYFVVEVNFVVDDRLLPSMPLGPSISERLGVPQLTALGNHPRTSWVLSLHSFRTTILLLDLPFRNV